MNWRDKPKNQRVPCTRIDCHKSKECSHVECPLRKQLSAAPRGEPTLLPAVIPRGWCCVHGEALGMPVCPNCLPTAKMNGGGDE